MAERNVNIAIDGPSGAGKSTIARAVAKALGMLYVDTGAMYRAIGLYAFENGIAPRDAAALGRALADIDIKLVYEGGVQRVFLNGRDVSEAIRRHEISAYASDVSALPAVRAFLLDLQRDMAKTHSVIMDGRDIGTVILPHADIKIFLTAAAEDRARRRFDELYAKGETVSYERVLEDVRVRDHNDETRAAAPLHPAPDAEIIDTTGNTLDESIELILNFVKERLS